MKITTHIPDQASRRDQKRLENPPSTPDDEGEGKDPPSQPPDDDPPAPVREPGRPRPEVEDPKPRRPQRAHAGRSSS